MFFKKKQEQSAEPAVVSAESSAERKLPLILRWPISIIFLFVMPPFGTAVGIGLAVARLIFNHKYPKYKLKLWTKLIISALCIAFVIWAVVTAPESSTTTSAEAVPTEQGESQATETTSEATENKTVEQETTSQAEQQAVSEQKKQDDTSGTTLYRFPSILRILRRIFMPPKPPKMTMSVWQSIRLHWRCMPAIRCRA